MKRIQWSKWFKRLKTAKKRLELFETAMKRLKRLKTAKKRLELFETAMKRLKRLKRLKDSVKWP